MSEPVPGIEREMSKYVGAEFCKSHLRCYQTMQITSEENDASPDSIVSGGFSLGRLYLPRLMKWLHDEFSSGRHTGTCLLDICCGPSILPALLSSRIFGEITMADINRDCLQEISKWVNCDTDAHDWRQYSEYAAALERNMTVQSIEERARKFIKRTVQFNIHNDVPLTGHYLPVDCVTGILALSSASPDNDTFMRNIKKVVSWLKPGGTVILVLGLNNSSYTMSGVKYNVANLSLDYVQECFSEAGLKDILYKIFPFPAYEGMVDTRKYIFLSAVY